VNGKQIISLGRELFSLPVIFGLIR